MNFTILAQNGESNCIIGFGPFGNLCERLSSDPNEGGATVLSELARAISRIIGIMTIVAGLWFLTQFLTAAFGWLTSGGDAQKLEDARKRIMNALVGLVLVVAALTIMGLVETFFGVPFLLGDPDSLAPTLVPGN